MESFLPASAAQSVVQAMSIHEDLSYEQVRTYTSLAVPVLTRCRGLMDRDEWKNLGLAGLPGEQARPQSSDSSGTPPDSSKPS